MRLFFSFIVISIAIAHYAEANTPRDNSLKVACMTSFELRGEKGNEQWCQCQNDYYANLLSDEDWEKYTNDYYALVRKQNSTANTPANSYARKVQIGNSHCRTCTDNQYQGCLLNDGKTPSQASYSNIYDALAFGEFSALSNNRVFKHFFIDFLHGYSAFCGNTIQNYTERTIVSTQWNYQNHIWWEGDTNVAKVRVNNKYFATFEQFEDILSQQMTGDYINDILESRRAGKMPGAGAAKIIASTIDSVSFMRDALSNQCTTPSVQTVYDNLYRFNANLEPNINPQLVEQRKQEKLAEQQKYAAIIEATKRSREEAIKIAAQQREQEKTKAKTSMHCDALYKETANNAAQLKTMFEPQGLSYQQLEGAWKGEFGQHEIELIAWPGYRSGDAMAGMVYFPDFDCLLSAGFTSKNRVGERRNVAHLELRMYSPNWRPKNCESLVKYSLADEIHFFNVRGFLNFSESSPSFSYFPSNSSLGKLTPQSCDNFEVQFQKHKVSKAFYQVLKQYPHPDKRGPQLTDSFLDKHH